MCGALHSIIAWELLLFFMKNEGNTAQRERPEQWWKHAWDFGDDDYDDLCVTAKMMIR